jgi:hypothetical protein
MRRRAASLWRRARAAARLIRERARPGGSQSYEVKVRCPAPPGSKAGSKPFTFAKGVLDFAKYAACANDPTGARTVDVPLQLQACNSRMVRVAQPARPAAQTATACC